MPSTPGNYSITCTISDVAYIPSGEEGDRDDYSDLVLTTTVNASDYVYEATIIEPTGTVGHTVPVKVKVRTGRCSLNSLVLKEHEETEYHSWEWNELGDEFVVSGHP